MKTSGGLGRWLSGQSTSHSYKHENPQFGLFTHVDLGMAVCICNPITGVGGRSRLIPGTHVPASLASLVSSGFNDRPCLKKKQGGKGLRKTSRVDF